TAAAPPRRIKLSLKLGALKLQTPTTASMGSRLSSAMGSAIEARRFSRTEASSDSGSEDIDVTDEYSRQPGSLYVAAAGEHVGECGRQARDAGGVESMGSGTHTPRIKLRFSMKEDQRGSVVPASPSESAASSGRVRGGGSSVDSDSDGEGEGDEEGEGEGEGEEGGEEGEAKAEVEGRTYSHVAKTTMKRGRGRPPTRGRAGARVAAAAATTTVSLRSSLQRLISRIRKRDSYGFFLAPVDTEAIPDYLGVVERPMDLGTIQHKVESKAYGSIGEFRSDVLLVCSNARKYNGGGSIYARSADRVQEYATVAIDRETAKLERVGQATVTVRCGNDSDSAFGTPQSRSASPAHGSDSGSDSQRRRAARRRWRGSSEPQAGPGAGVGAAATAAGIADMFKWSGGKRRAKKASGVPRRSNEQQAKMAVQPDGSADAGGAEEEARAPPGFGDYGPLCTAHGAAGAGARISGAVADLQTIHGDGVGLAYWRSVAEFIDGAGAPVAAYAAVVMDHLTAGGHAVARDALGPARGGGGGGVGTIVDWLASRPARDRLYAQRVDALTRPMTLRDVSARHADGDGGGGGSARPLTDGDKRRLLARTSGALKAMHGQRAALPPLREVEDDLYALAEGMCLALTGSAHAAARLPGLARMPPGAGAAPWRAASAPSLPTLSSASLAAAVRSDMLRDLALLDAEADHA
ncbi:hypothetical protein GGI04_000264, partial [Coemansia thaxteri]